MFRLSPAITPEIQNNTILILKNKELIGDLTPLSPTEAFIIYDQCSAPSADDYITPLEAGLSDGNNLPLKKSGSRHTGELCPKLTKWSIPTQEVDIDNNTRFRYQVGYWRPLSDASICGTKADADTQLTIFDSSALKKQLLIFYLLFGVYENNCFHRR